MTFPDNFKNLSFVQRYFIAIAVVLTAWGCGEETTTETCEESCQRRANDAYNSCLQSGQTDAECRAAGETAFGQCNVECGGAAPQGGTPGAAGMTGMAGTPGTGGTAGTPGTGGNAGTPGAGGTPGTGGMPGAGGTPGTGGTPGAGGAGGEAGAGGMGSMDPPPPNVSCEGRDIPSVNDAPGATPTSFTFNGSVEPVDNFSGSCSAPGLNSADTVISFTAPSAGAYLFSLEGTEFDTVLYVRTTCSDPESELECNDDSGMGLWSRLSVNLEADQTVFVFVDTFNAQMLEAAPFTLAITQETAPLLTDSVYVQDAEELTLGIVIQGNNPEGDTSALRIELYDGAGEVLAGGQANFDTINHQANGDFEGALTLTYPEEAAGFTRVETRAVRENGVSSDPLDAVQGQSADVGRGAECNTVTTVCSGGDLCVEAICTDSAEVAACPADWAVTPINVGPDGSGMINGDNSNSMGGYREASCSGNSGLATDIYSFSTPLAGTYVISTAGEDLDPEDDIEPDTILYARSLCNFDGPQEAAQDLACNDDIPGNDMGQESSYFSEITFEADAGQTIYLFVDAYNTNDEADQWRGAYTLSIRLQ